MKRYRLFLHYFLPIILFICIQSVCISAEITDTTIIKVSDIEISEYEFEKNLSRDYPDTVATKEWITNFIDRAYLLAEAYHLEYNTHPEVMQTVNQAEMYMVTQSHGLLADDIVKDIVIDESMLHEVYERNILHYHIEYLKFLNERDMIKALGNRKVIDINTFQNIASQCDDINEIEYKTMTVKWPMQEPLYEREYIYAMKENQISEPIALHIGIFIVHLIKIENLHMGENHPSYDTVKPNLLKIAEIAEQDRSTMQYDMSIFEKAQICINYDIADEIVARFPETDLLFHINESNYDDIIDTEIISYIFNNQRKQANVGEFIKFYNGIAMQQQINSRKNVYMYLREFVFERYAYADAVKRGLTQTKKFILDKRNLTNKVIYDVFIKNELGKKIIVSADELKTVYDNRTSSFSSPTHVTVSTYIFDNDLDAQSVYHFIDGSYPEIKIPDEITEKIENAYTGKHEIPFNSQEFSQEIITTIFALQKDKKTFPIEYNGKFYIFKKLSERGTRLKPFEEVHDELEQTLREEKLEAMKQELLIELKKKYSIENNIDYAKYLN